MTKETVVWVVYGPCDCETDDCFGTEMRALYTTEQTAKQYVNSRAPWERLHYGKEPVLTKMRTW